MSKKTGLLRKSSHSVIEFDPNKNHFRNLLFFSNAKFSFQFSIFLNFNSLYKNKIDFNTHNEFHLG